MRRLAEYRNLNTEDETVLNYFDELEFHPEHVGMYKVPRPLTNTNVDRVLAFASSTNWFVFIVYELL